MSDVEDEPLVKRIRKPRKSSTIIENNKLSEAIEVHTPFETIQDHEPFETFQEHKFSETFQPIEFLKVEQLDSDEEIMSSDQKTLTHENADSLSLYYQNFGDKQEYVDVMYLGGHLKTETESPEHMAFPDQELLFPEQEPSSPAEEIISTAGCSTSTHVNYEEVYIKGYFSDNNDANISGDPLDEKPVPKRRKKKRKFIKKTLTKTDVRKEPKLAKHQPPIDTTTLRNPFFNPIPEPEVEKFSCTRCYLSLIEASDFEGHLSAHKVPEPIAEFKSYRYSITFPKKSSAKTFITCGFCGKKFSEVKRLHVHISKEHCYCRVCGVATLFDKFNRLGNHISSHDTSFKHIYKCFKCQFECNSWTEMSRHNSAKHKNGYRDTIKIDRIYGFECPYCLFGAKDSKVLMYHMTLHKTEHCSKCGYNFIMLGVHVVDCEYKICFKCDHLKYIKWSIENKDFRDYPCVYCPATLGDGVDLYKHMVTCHYYCHFCCDTCTSADSLKSHQESCKTYVNILKNPKKCNPVVRTDLLVESILTNSQCCYCLQIVSPYFIEEHFQVQHNMVRCKCSKFRILGRYCSTCKSI